MFKQLFQLVIILTSIHCIAQAPAGLSKGEIKGPINWLSKIYPGTERNYWIYVPAQYDASKPACVMVVLDGLGRATGWNLPAVMDSLIALKQIPVTIGIFIDPGRVPAASNDAFPRYNRSLEYDGMGDRYARFLVEEILPEVGRTYNLSKDPNARSIAGASSGAICAFNAAWERPDEFRRVLSTIGTYVGLRGGDTFATLVRKTEPKPIRVFLEDGDHDLNIYAGDWWMANQNMLSALTWNGYEVNHAWGTGGHDSKHAKTIMAEALQWLWKDFPAPVQVHKGANQINLVVENEPWKELSMGNLKVNKLAVNNSGEVYFTSGQSVYRIDENGSPSEFIKLKGEAGGLSFGADRKLFVGDLTQHKIVMVDETRKPTDLVKNVTPDFIMASRKGIYFSETASDRVGYYSFEKKTVQYVAVPGHPTGISLSAEQTFMNVGLANQPLGYSLKVLEDGSLDFGQEYIHYHVPYGNAVPDVGGNTVDAENSLYTSTAMGIQVSDQLGRVNFIISKPGEHAWDVKFGGKDFNVLYVNCSGKLYRRKMNRKGILSWQPPVKPPQPRM